MKTTAWILAAVVASTGMMGVSRAESPDPKSILEAMDSAGKELCREISKSIIRVHIDQGLDFPSNWSQEYKEWRDSRLASEMHGRGGGRNHENTPAATGTATTQPATQLAGPGGGGGPGGGPASPGGPGGGPGGMGAGGGPGRGGMGGSDGWGGNPFSFRRFLEDKLNSTQDAETIAKIRFAMQKMDAVRNGQGPEVSAVIIDPQGHALVLTPIQRDPKKPLQITMSDGTETTATVTGVDLVRGLSIIHLEKAGASSANLSEHLADPGQLLMGISANRNTVTWAMPPIPGKPDMADDRFPLAGNEDRSPTFFFDVSGKLMAVSITGRQAIPIATLADKLGQLVQGNDLIPTPVGIRYTDVGEKSNYRLPSSPSAGKLGERPAVHVDSVFKGSLAEKAGFKAGDFLVALDGKPLSPTFVTNPSADLESRGAIVIFTVIREDREIDLEMHRDQKPEGH